LNVQYNQPQITDCAVTYWLPMKNKSTQSMILIQTLLHLFQTCVN